MLRCNELFATVQNKKAPEGAFLFSGWKISAHAARGHETDHAQTGQHHQIGVRFRNHCDRGGGGSQGEYTAETAGRRTGDLVVVVAGKQVAGREQRAKAVRSLERVNSAGFLLQPHHAVGTQAENGRRFERYRDRRERRGGSAQGKSENFGKGAAQ